jgi:drug/metabolite transporter (DMT)-like permease
MEELFLIFLRSLLDAVLAIFAGPFHGSRKFATLIDWAHFLAGEFIWFIGGCVSSGVALALTNQPAISSFRFLTTIVFLVPLASACLLQRIRQRDQTPDSRDSLGNYFFHALWYSSGFALTRLFFSPGL